jgi:hypothetical protein
LSWTQTLLDVIDFRSFSSLWYWIVVAVTWSSASHWVLGVPFDMVVRARRQGGQATADLEDLARINVRRLLDIARLSGLWLAGSVTFALSALLVLGAWYRIEFAQAVLFLAIPLTAVGALSLSTARGIAEAPPDGAELVRRLVRHRFRTQAVGVVAIFVTAMFGMYHNLAALRAW